MWLIGGALLAAGDCLARETAAFVPTLYAIDTHGFLDGHQNDPSQSA
jgi:hypothetical protein